MIATQCLTCRALVAAHLPVDTIAMLAAGCYAAGHRVQVNRRLSATATELIARATWAALPLSVRHAAAKAGYRLDLHR